MGKNKHTRKLTACQLQTIEKHLAKIEAELGKADPNMEWIEGWEKEIDNARKRVRVLEKRLEKQTCRRQKQQRTRRP